MERKIVPLLFGSDPEFLLRNISTKELVSSIGIIPGTKDEPVTVDALGEGYTIQIDNVLGEISVAPSETIEGLWDNIQKALDYIKNNILPEGIEILHASSGVYTEEQLDNEIARAFGCSPSINAWSQMDNTPPEANGIMFRGCGAHIHLSYEDPDENTNCLIGRVFDLFCTLPSLLLETDSLRRRLYGQAGEIRHCSYGVELRTLGGFMLADKAYYDFLLNNLLQGIKFINEGNTIDVDFAMGIQIAINNNNKEFAKEILKSFNIPVYSEVN